MRREADLQFQESFVQRPGSFSPAAWEKRFGIQCLEGVFFFFFGGGGGGGASRIWGLGFEVEALAVGFADSKL